MLERRLVYPGYAVQSVLTIRADRMKGSTPMNAKRAQMNANVSVLSPMLQRLIGCSLMAASRPSNGILPKQYENAFTHE